MREFKIQKNMSEGDIKIMCRESYAVICNDEEENLRDVEKVLKIKNLGRKTMQKLMKQISCIQGVAYTIDECYGLDYTEILDLLEKFYGHEVINKEDMIEPYNYMLLDVYYNWELYAQNQSYAKESDTLVIDGLKEELEKIIKGE